MLAIGLCTIISSMRTFGAEKTNFWRESARGINRYAYFCGKNLIDVPKLMLVPIFFMILFYGLTARRASLAELYGIILAGAFAVSGIGYTISMVASFQDSQLIGIVVVLILGILSGLTPTLKDVGLTPV